MSINAFPRIRHLPGSHTDVDDLVMSGEEARAFLSKPVAVYEKLDGMNLAISVERGALAFALKFDWRRALDGAVERAIAIHLLQREACYRAMLDEGRVIYGEWLWHRIHVKYARLPDVFMMFALEDATGTLVERRAWEKRARSLGIAVTAPVFTGTLRDIPDVKRLVKRSSFGDARMEGVLLEQHSRRGMQHAKWVDASYVHRRKGRVSGERNGLATRLPS